MAATVGYISTLLKERYEGPIREQINREALIYQLFSEGPHQWDGDTVRIPLHIGGVAAGSVQYLAESIHDAHTAAPAAPYVPMPIAGQQQHGKMNVDAKHIYASFEVTGQAEAKAPGAAGGSEGAFVGAMFSEMRGLEKDIRSSMNKDMFTGQGFDGFLVDGGQPLTGVGAGVLVGRRVSGANHLVNNGVYRCWHVPRDPTVGWTLVEDGAGNDEYTLTALDTAAGTCTLTSAGAAGPDAATLAIADTDLIVMERIDVIGAVTPTRPGVNEINGLNCLAFGAELADAYGNARDALNNTVLRGFGFKTDVAVAPGLGFAAGQPLALEDMQLVLDGIEDLTEETIDTIVMHRFTRARFRALAQESPRYLPGETDAHLGHKAGSLMFEDTPITVSKDAPYGVVYFLVGETINTYTLKPGGFQRFTDSGDVITQKRDAATNRLLDVREGFWKQYFNLVSELPRAIGVMAGISYKRA